MEGPSETHNPPVGKRMLGGGWIVIACLVLLPACSLAQRESKSETQNIAATAPSVGDEIANVSSLPNAPQASGQDSPQSTDGPHAKKQKKSALSANNGSPGHIYWVIPAFKVNYGGHFTPLTPKEKFTEWAQGVYDPLGLAVGAFEAGTLQYSSKDGFCGYGHGWDGYGKCFASSQADSTISSFLGDYVLTVWWHQDPRYFRLGRGSFGKRLFYAVSRVFVTYNDAGKNVFYSSALSGTAIAAGISNLYYPKSDRGVSNSVSRAGLDLGNTAIYNAAAEFWPDIHSVVLHIFRQSKPVHGSR